MADPLAAVALALYGDPTLGQTATYTPAPGAAGAPAVLPLRLARPVVDPFGGESGGSARTAAAVAHVPAAAFAAAGLARPSRGATLVLLPPHADGVTYRVGVVEGDPGAPTLRLVLTK